MTLPELGAKLLALTSRMPRKLLPMLAMSAVAFDDPACLFEVKWDGVRAMTADSWRIRGREGVDYTDRYPELSVLRELPSGTMLDGELAVVRDGVADFHALMARHARRLGRRPYAEPVRYVVFDLLYLGGERAGTVLHVPVLWVAPAGLGAILCLLAGI